MNSQKLEGYEKFYAIKRWIKAKKEHVKYSLFHAWRRVLAAVTAGTLAMALAACGANGTATSTAQEERNNTPAVVQTQEPVPSPVETQDTAPQPAQGGYEGMTVDKSVPAAYGDKLAQKLGTDTNEAFKTITSVSYFQKKRATDSNVDTHNVTVLKPVLTDSAYATLVKATNEGDMEMLDSIIPTSSDDGTVWNQDSTKLVPVNEESPLPILSRAASPEAKVATESNGTQYVAVKAKVTRIYDTAEGKVKYSQDLTLKMIPNSENVWQIAGWEGTAWE